MSTTTVSARALHLCFLSLLGCLGVLKVAAEDAPIYYFMTFAGQSGVAGVADGQGTAALLNSPTGIAIDSSQNLYVGDQSATIRRITPTGLVTLFAGSSTGKGGAADGVGSAARFSQSIRGLTVALDGNIYVCDGANYTIRKITSAGEVTTLSGQMPSAGAQLVVIDGSRTVARFFLPDGICADKDGNLVVGDILLRRVSLPFGQVETLLGNPVLDLFSSPAFQGRSGGTPHTLSEIDGPLDSAKFYSVTAVSSDKAGNLYFLEYFSGGLVRKLSTDSIVSTIAGNIVTETLTNPITHQPATSLTIASGSSDGNGPDARFNHPTGIAVADDGTLFVVDAGTSRIRRISSSGLVTTIGGSVSGSQDGLGITALFKNPTGIALDAAGNLFITDTGNHTIRKGVRVVAPKVTTPPQSQASLPEQTLTLSVAYTSNAPATFQWSKDGVALSGETNATLSLTNLQIAGAGSYTVTVTNAAGSVTSAAATISVGTPPAISTQPVAQLLLGGQALTLSVTAGGSPSPTFQWKKDGVAISGATSPIYTVTNAQASDAGSYSVTVTNAAGVVTSTAIAVAVNTSRISNLSILSTLSPNAPLLTVGFVVSGSGKTLLARAAGPALGTLGVGGFLADPRIGLFSGTTAIASNDNWGTAANAAQVATTTNALGGFALPAGSADAALLTTFNDGGYSAQITGPTAAASGLVLVELYDANSTTAARLINVSAAAQVGTDGAVLIAGFIVTGNAKKTLLIRAIGPTLGALGVGGVLADPKLELFGAGNALVANNDNWGGDSNLSATFSSVGAFALANPASKDAVLLVTLDPGNYSAQVSGVSGSTGLALIEIYEVK